MQCIVLACTDEVTTPSP